MDKKKNPEVVGKNEALPYSFLGEYVVATELPAANVPTGGQETRRVVGYVVKEYYLVHTGPDAGKYQVFLLNTNPLGTEKEYLCDASSAEFTDF